MDIRTLQLKINPNDDPVYTTLRNGSIVGSRVIGRRINEMAELAKTDDLLEIALIIPQNYLVLQVEDKHTVDAIVDLKENLWVFKTDQGYNILGQSFYDKTTENNILACGIKAHTLSGKSRTKNYIPLPFKSKNNTSNYLKKHSLVYAGQDIGYFPEWLEPVHKLSRDEALDALKPPYQSVTDIAKRLKDFTAVQRENILKIINEKFLAVKLTDAELESQIKNTNIVSTQNFFDGHTFQHNILGEYLISKCNIKRDKDSKLLFHYNEREKIYEHNEDYLLGFMTHLVPTLKEHQKQETLKYIESYLFMDPQEFNSDPYTIVFKNGILDIATLDFEPMDETKLESVKLNVNYKPEAIHEAADEFFQTATINNKEVEQLLYEAIGYSMLKTSELQTAFMLTGEGRNGKSTFLDVVERILGKYNTTSISFKDLANNFRASALDGKLASLARDISSTPITDSDLVKSIIAGEPIMIERKYKDAYDKGLFATLFFSANKLPHTPDTTHGFYRRFTIIPFNADLSKVSTVDGAMFSRKLLSQTSLDYIAYKSVLAIHKVLNSTKEFIQPKVVIEMLQQYKTENSSVLAFLEDVYKNNHQKLIGIGIKNLYQGYEEWCTSNNYKRFAFKRFEQELFKETKFSKSNNNTIVHTTEIV